MGDKLLLKNGSRLDLGTGTLLVRGASDPDPDSGGLVRLRSPKPTNEVNWDDPLNKGLVAWYPFRQSGGKLRDVASGNVATTQSGDWILAPPLGAKALDFNPTDYADLPINELDKDHYELSCFCWVNTVGNPSGDPAKKAGIVSKYFSASTHRSWSISLTPDEKLSFAASSDGTYQSDGDLVGSSTVPLSEWFFCGFTFKGGTISKLFFNGIKDAEDSSTVDFLYGHSTTTRLAVDFDLGDSLRYLNAAISDVRIYNRALSESEVHDLYQASRTGYVDQFKRRSFPVGVTPTPTESHPSNGLIRLRSPKQTQPSYKAGYAKSAAESAYPELWRNLIRAWVPALGNGGTSLRELITKSQDAIQGTFSESTWGMSANGAYVFFDGTDSNYIYSTIEPDKPMTVVTLQKADANGVCLSISDPTQAANQWYVSVLSNGEGRLGARSPNFVDAETSNRVEPYEVCSIVGVIRSSTLREVYLNGDIANKGVSTTSVSTASQTRIMLGGLGDSTPGYQDSKILAALVFDRALSEEEIAVIGKDPLAPFRQRRSIPFGVTISGAQAYTLTADTGAFNLTGNDATLTGPATAYTLTADTGSFTLTGNDADPDADRQLVASAGAFTLTGTDATLTKAGAYTLAAETVAFTLTGTATDLDADRQLSASTGAYTLTGNDAILTKSSFSKFVADTGTFTLTGNDTALKADHDVAASTGSYTLTGSAAGLPADRQLAADTASFSLTGNDATLTYAPTDPTLTAATGSFTETGNDATLTVSRKLTADTTSYTVAGNDTATKASRKFLATVASFDLDGPAVNLELSRRIALDTLTYNLTGVNTRLSYSEEDVSSIIQATSASIRCPQANGSISCADSDGTFVTP